MKVIEAYYKATGQLRTNTPVFSQVLTLDLATVVSSVSGPKRPNDRVTVSDMKNDFRLCLTNKVGDFLIKTNCGYENVRKKCKLLLLKIHNLNE